MTLDKNIRIINKRSNSAQRRQALLDSENLKLVNALEKEPPEDQAAIAMAFISKLLVSEFSLLQIPLIASPQDKDNILQIRFDT